MSLWQLVGARQSAFTLLLSDAVLRSPNGYLSPLGVGAFELSEEAKWRNRYPTEPYQYGLYLNAIRVDPSRMTEPAWIPLDEIGSIKEQLLTDFPNDANIFLEDGWAFVGPPPVLHAQPGDVVLTNTSIGTFGAEVIWGATYGLLTAGHVGVSVGTPVYTASPAGSAHHVGNVIFCQTAAGAGPRGGADVAVVELSGNKPSSWGGKQSGVVLPLSNIEVALNSGPALAAVKGMFRWLAYPGTNVVFADTYMTDSAITRQGDSGAVATDPQTGDIAGHVVGGTPQVASYIQEIDYQLGVIAANGQFANITL